MTTSADLDHRLEAWMAALEARQLRDLTFSETTRALRALSSTSLELRGKLGEGAALDSAGKRAAFALFYGPLHFLLVHYITTQLGSKYTSIRTLLELGCGTGASAAGWALACEHRPRVTGIDRHPWAVDEARRTFADLNLEGSFRIADLNHDSVIGSRVRRKAGSFATAQDRARFTAGDDAILAAYTVNEIADPGSRARLLQSLLAAARGNVRVLIVEPLAGFVAPWWGEWQLAFEAAGGRSDQWRVRLPLPSIVEKLDRAAGLNHRELKARTLAL